MVRGESVRDCLEIASAPRNVRPSCAIFFRISFSRARSFPAISAENSSGEYSEKAGGTARVSSTIAGSALLGSKYTFGRLATIGPFV